MFLCVYRQLDCLRQLVVVLCERSQLKDLVQFSYVNLHDEVSVHILACFYLIRVALALWMPEVHVIQTFSFQMVLPFRCLSAGGEYY